MKNIAILTGGDSAEYDISILSAKNVKANLNKDLFKGYIVHLKKNKFHVIINNNAISLKVNDFSFKINNKKIMFDAVFMALHGPPAEDGQIQKYFENINIPYTSCDSITSYLTFNKYKCNKQLIRLGFNCAKSYLYKTGEDINQNNVLDAINFPCFVKPNKSGSSYGVSKVDKKNKLLLAIKKSLKYDNQVLIEQFIEGLEISIGVFENQNKIQTLPITEIVSFNDFFDYEAKYSGKSKEITPARINKKIKNIVHKNTINLYKKMKLKGVCRIDYIIKEDKPYVIEINTIPGLSQESIIPKQLKHANISLPDFFELCINNIIN